MNRKSDTTVGANSFAVNGAAQNFNDVAFSGIARGGMSVAFDGDAQGYYSRSLGFGTKANSKSNFVFGEYNKQDQTTLVNPIRRGNFVEIVGNGTSDNDRSNARTLDWDGNETLAGDLVYNGNKSLTSEVQRLDDKIDALPEPMVFKGTLGVGGTILTLPVASAENEGWMFKCITAGTYEGLTLKVGDTVTCFNPPNTSTYYWDKTGSQDTDTDTWRAIKVEGVEKLGNGISSGAVDFRGSANIDVTFDADGNKVEIATKNIYTQTEVDNLVAQAIVDILPTETKSGSVANFETDLVLPYQLAKFGIVATQASGTPTPSNPLAISGVSSVKTVKCGANLCNQADIVSAYPSKYTIDTDGSIKTVGNLGLSDVLWTNTSKASGSLNIIFVSKYQNTGSVGIRPKIIYTDGTNSDVYTTNTQDYSTKTLLTASGKTVEKIVVDYGTNNPTNFYLMVTLDTSATTFEAYNGQEITIALGDTYYGGYVEVDKDGHRRLVVTYGRQKKLLSEYSAKDNLTDTIKYIFYNFVSATPIRNNKQKCNVAEFGYHTLDNTHFYLASSTNLSIWLPTDTPLTTEIEVIFELETPIIIDIPDGEPITALNGVNNVFCDSGDTEVTYKLSINKALSNLGGGNRSVSLAKSVEEEVKEEPKDEPETRQER